MTLLLSAALSVLLVEVALRLPLRSVVARIGRTAGSALRVLRAASVSDHWKEKAMLAYSGRMFACSFHLALMLLVLGGAAAVLIFVFDRISPNFSGFLVEWWGLALTLLLASIYLAARSFLAHGRLQPARPALTSTRPAGGSDR